MADDKIKALESAINDIEKAFGKGSIMKLGEVRTDNIPSVPTGSLSLDLALGVGGVPRGRVIEIYGPESSGKTTVALHIVAEVQKAGGYAAYIDAEHAMDPIYAKKIGVNIDELYISQPDDGEQALEIAEAMVRSGAIEVVVIDSVAALVPRAEIAGDMGDSHMGLQARLMSQALRKMTGFINKTNCILIFINQLREKIGVSFGPNETTTGGRALKFYASVRMEIRRSDSLKSGTDIIGNRTKVKISKNKVAPPFKTCEFDIIYGEGISKEGDILDVAAANNIVSKSGSWYYYQNGQLGQGKDNIRTFLKENKDICKSIEGEVRTLFNLKPLEKSSDKVTVAIDKKDKKSKGKSKKEDKEKDEKEDKEKAEDSFVESEVEIDDNFPSEE